MRKYILLIITALFLAGCRNDPIENPTFRYATCNADTGLSYPLPACLPDNPCTRTANDLDDMPINTPSDKPVCSLEAWNELHTLEVSGFTRYACIYKPPGTSVDSPRPLLLWFHPGGSGSADLAETETGLLEKAKEFDLTGDPERPGFILVSVQGRNLRFPTAAPRDGRHHDFYYRDLNAPSTNPDIANADTLIDTLVSGGIVDKERIYVSGWSNGAFFSQLYAVARHSKPTGGGNKVAAAAVFSAADPFDGISWDPFQDTVYNDENSCRIDIPESNVPILMVYRTADAAVACNQNQADCFSTEPGYSTKEWIEQASNTGIQIEGLLIGGLESRQPANLDQVAAYCTDFGENCPTGSCSTNPLGDACMSMVNHQRWPDGKYGNFPYTGIDREFDMLEFLKNNPL